MPSVFVTEWFAFNLLSRVFLPKKENKNVQKTGSYLLIERGFKSTQTTKGTIGRDKE